MPISEVLQKQVATGFYSRLPGVSSKLLLHPWNTRFLRYYCPCKFNVWDKALQFLLQTFVYKRNKKSERISRKKCSWYWCDWSSCFLVKIKHSKKSAFYMYKQQKCSPTNIYSFKPICISWMSYSTAWIQ